MNKWLTFGLKYEFLSMDIDLHCEVQELIEEMYSDAGNMPVVIISHCYGVTSFAYWLGSMDQAWKEKFIKAFVPVAG